MRLQLYFLKFRHKKTSDALGGFRKDKCFFYNFILLSSELVSINLL